MLSVKNITKQQQAIVVVKENIFLNERYVSY